MHDQWLTCNRTQGKAILPPTENGSRYSPISPDILWTQRNGGKGDDMEMECRLTVWSYNASWKPSFCISKRHSQQ